MLCPKCTVPVNAVEVHETAEQIIEYSVYNNSPFMVWKYLRGSKEEPKSYIIMCKHCDYVFSTPDNKVDAEKEIRKILRS
jgi:hypothetical protein